jgi:hypothetical protein
VQPGRRIGTAFAGEQRSNFAHPSKLQATQGSSLHGRNPSGKQEAKLRPITTKTGVRQW